MQWRMCEKRQQSAASMTYFTVESMIRGYQIYKDIWESSIGEKLFCEIEETNRLDYKKKLKKLIFVGSNFCEVLLPREIR